MTSLSRHVLHVHREAIPRVPFEVHLDLTYRCNLHCLHCWIRLPVDAPQLGEELSFEEIRKIADQSRALGTRRWSISGGEPLLREDFAEIFEYLTFKAVGYTLNTNGTLITPRIAKQFRRSGTKLVALYGATAEVYDAVTRCPGGFDDLMRGIRFLREAGAAFTVQLIPMRGNWHQWHEMQALARSLSAQYRVGAPWLFLSSSGEPETNRSILSQRLSPRDVIALDEPVPAGSRHSTAHASGYRSTFTPSDDRLFAGCIATRREYHVDPYGQMTWCSSIKDQALRYDLRSGTVREGWDDFIPSCSDRVRGGDEWRAHCGSCERRNDCRWCAVYAHLETGRYSAPVPYLCAVATEARSFLESRHERHRRYFRVAGITVCVESEVDFDEIAFNPALCTFEVQAPGEDTITLTHHFEMPDLEGWEVGRELYRKPPWAISRLQSGAWIYRGISNDDCDHHLHRLAVFSSDYTRGTIFNPPRDLDLVREQGWPSLSLFPTDQIWLAALLADRAAVLLHSSAVILGGQGLVFVGRSGAGKSTILELLRIANLGVEILCDDRNVIRGWGHPVAWRVHGTWSHGTTIDVSAASAPLRAVFFLEKNSRNEIQKLTDQREIRHRLIARLVRPMGTAEWWQKEIDLLGQLAGCVRCYLLRFDLSGEIARMVADFATK